MEIKRKISAYTSQFRRTVLHGVAAPSWLENGDSALVRVGEGGEVSNTASFVVLRSEIPQQDFPPVCPPFRFYLFFSCPEKRTQRDEGRNSAV